MLDSLGVQHLLTKIPTSLVTFLFLFLCPPISSLCLHISHSVNSSSTLDNWNIECLDITAIAVKIEIGGK